MPNFSSVSGNIDATVTSAIESVEGETLYWESPGTQALPVSGQCSPYGMPETPLSELAELDQTSEITVLGTEVASQLPITQEDEAIGNDTQDLVTGIHSVDSDSIAEFLLVGSPSTDPLINSDNSQSKQPLIGLIDTGFSANHADLDYSRIHLGQDWVDGDNNPLLQAGDNEHGTRILELIGATQGNGIGIDGINHAAPIWLGRAVGSGQWAASLIEFVDALKASGQHNAIANLSFDLTQLHPDGTITTRYELTPQEQTALEYARQHGVVVVVAAGNEGGEISALGQASRQFDNIITVGAADNLNRAVYSSYGVGLDVLADGSGSISGTSMAAARVSGVASQLWAVNPDLSYRQVIQILKATATDLHTPGWDAETGAGRLNADTALELARQTVAEQYTPQAIAIADTWSGDGQIIPMERAAAVSVTVDTNSPSPPNGATGVSTQPTIRIEFSGAIDQSTLSTSSFRLIGPDGVAVAATVGSDLTGGVASLTPLTALKPFTTYTLEITSQLEGLDGDPVTPFTSSFTTGTQGSTNAGLQFNRAQVLSGESRFGVSSIAVGPDGHVYASDILGNILRYNINPTTGLADSVDTVFSQSNAQIVGIAFDPDATATNLTLWISYASHGVGNFSGTISKLTIPGEGMNGATTKQDVITGLPHSGGLQHQANGIAFGPDGKLYQTVGGVTTLGGSPNWDASESLLSAALIVADVKNHPAFQGSVPVNVQTVGLNQDNDPTTNNYNPYAPNAPVQIYATGLRNAYDLVWHSNGNLYTALNQNSIPGWVTPSAPGVPSINARPDEALALVQPGKYYGHPNPSRGEFVLNGGNPTSGVDPWEITAYPIGVQPDSDFDSTLMYNIRPVGGTSPNGMAEYTGPGLLNGRLLVSFFSGARTIHSFAFGANGLVTANSALKNANNQDIVFKSPLDVAVHPSGRIYVADFGNSQNDPNAGAVWVLNPITQPVTQPSVIITQSNGSTNVTEGGASDTYNLVLSTQPTANVTIALTPNAQLSTNTNSITFTPNNWNVAQTVTVTAVNDAVVEGTHTGSIRHNISSTDSRYNNLTIANLNVNITDNDNSPGVVLTQTGGSTAVTEGGASDTYNLVLSTQPTANVTITLATDGQTTTNKTTLTFTPNNWNSPQTVTVTAVDDTKREGIHTSNITHTISSSDSRYNNLSLPSITATVSDNDGGKALFVANSLNLGTTDQLVKTRLENLGYEVTVQDDDLSSSSNANGQDLVVISESVSSGAVNTKFRNVTVPVLTWEPYLYDDFGMTGTTVSTNYGFVANQTTVAITNSTHPLAANLSGSASVYNSSGSMAWATPNANAVKIATLNEDSQKATIFAYDQGAALFGGLTAPARRVGFFLMNMGNEGTRLTTPGWQLFDAAVAWATAQTPTPEPTPTVTITQTGGSTAVTEGGASDTYSLVLSTQPTANVTISLTTNGQISTNNSSVTFTASNWNVPQTITVTAVDDSVQEGTHTSQITHTISSNDSRYDDLSIPSISVSITDNDEGSKRALLLANSLNLGTIDQLVKNRLEGLGYEVTVQNDDLSSSSDANGQDLVMISRSVDSTLVNTKFRNVAVPVLTWEPYLYDDLGLTESTFSSDHGFMGKQSGIAIANSTHPLAANLSGSASVYSGSGKLAWGIPNANALKIATLSGDSQKATIFAYDQGASLFGGLTAPARRVGFFLMSEAGQLTTAGWQLFDAAVAWADD